MESENQPSPGHGGASRRTIVKGAAWSVPAIMTAVALPSSAASPLCTTITYSAPVPTAIGESDDAAVTTDFIVPDGVTMLSFQVAGAAGGGGSGIGDNPSGRGGSGALVTGAFAVVPGETLRLIVGQGGFARTFTGDLSLTKPALEGGKGYGSGGNVELGNATSSSQGGSGGGGSAILRGSSPLVVAGGGGGRGTRVWTVGHWERPGGAPNGGDAGSTGDGVRIQLIGDTSTFVEGHGGAGATAAAPGAGGSFSYSPRNDGTRTGASGWAHEPVPAGPLPPQILATLVGQGGIGRSAYVLGVAAGGGNACVISGAGGGGYHGGGSGGAVGLDRKAMGRGIGLAAGGGGGGASYTSPEVGSLVVASAGNSPAATETRSPGWIVLTYEQCF